MSQTKTETNIVANGAPQITPSAPRASIVTTKNTQPGEMSNPGPKQIPGQGQSGTSGVTQVGKRGPQIVQRGPQGRPMQGGPRPGQAGAQQGRPPSGQQPPQQQAPRTFNFSDFDMPWAVTKAGFKYHSAISQFNQAFFYYGRVAITFAIGLPLYGTIPAFTGTRNSEDLLFWKCDTSHPGCDIICYNRFLPIMPGRLLQFQLLFFMLPDVVFLLYFARFESAKKRSEMAKNPNLQISEEKREKYKSQKHIDKEKTTVHLWGGSVGPVLWNAKIARAVAICQTSKFLIDLMNLLTYNWLLQHQYNMPIYQREDEDGELYTFPAQMMNFTAYTAPEGFACMVGKEAESTCSNLNSDVTSCYNTRSYEKTYFNFYILVMNVLSLILLFTDCLRMAIRHVQKKRKRQDAPIEEVVTEKSKLL